MCTMTSGVSFLVCTHNGAVRLASSLRALARQAGAVDIAWEVVLVDNASTDDTTRIAAAGWERAGNVAPLQLLREPRPGKNFALARAFEQARYCYACIVDDDNCLDPHYLATGYALLAADTQALAVFSDAVLIDGTGGELPGSLWARWGFTRERQAQWLDNDLAFADLLANRNVITGATLAFRKELLPFLIPFELPAVYWHDAWVGLVAAARGGLRFLPAPTIRYRIHSQQQAGTLSGASDRKFVPVSPGYFLKKVARLFPEKRSIVYRDSPSLSRRVANKLLRIGRSR